MSDFIHSKLLFLRTAAYVLLSLIIPLAVFEVWMEYGFLSEEVKLLRDPDHRMKPFEDGNNSDGLRMHREAVDFQEKDFNVVFLGDSYVYGWALKAKETLPARFEKLLQAAYPDRTIRVANFGWISSSPVLSLRLLMDLGGKYKPDLVILALDMSDFHDDLKYGKLIEHPGIWALSKWIPAIFILAHNEIKQLCSLLGIAGFYEWLFGLPLDRFFIVNRPLIESEPHLGANRDSLDALAAYSSQTLKAPFLLAVFPRGFQYSDKETPDNWEAKEYTTLGPYVEEPFHYFQKLSREVDYPILSLLETFKSTKVFPTCFEKDPHWNEHGVLVVAQALVDYCRATRCVK